MRGGVKKYRKKLQKGAGMTNLDTIAFDLEDGVNPSQKDIAIIDRVLNDCVYLTEPYFDFLEKKEV